MVDLLLDNPEDYPLTNALQFFHLAFRRKKGTRLFVSSILARPLPSVSASASENVPFFSQSLHQRLSVCKFRTLTLAQFSHALTRSEGRDKP